MFVGYPFAQKGYTLLNLITNKTFVSRDVIFHESVFPLNGASPDSYIQPTPVEMTQTNAYCHDDIVVDEVQEPDTTESTNAPSPQPEVRRSSRISHKPTWLGDYVNNVHSSAHIVSVIDLPLEDQFHYFSATVTTNADPVNFKQAVQCAN